MSHLKNIDGLKINWYTVVDICNMSDKTYNSFKKIFEVMSKHNPFIKSKEESINIFDKYRKFNYLITEDRFELLIGMICINNNTIGMICISEYNILQSITILPKYRNKHYATRCILGLDKVCVFPFNILATDDLGSKLKKYGYVISEHNPRRQKDGTHYYILDSKQSKDIIESLSCLEGDITTLYLQAFHITDFARNRIRPSILIVPDLE